MSEHRGFTRRYLVAGTLSLTTAMHIGGGYGTLSPTDAPVLLTPEGKPYIPGSSFKGSFRSTVERLARSIPGIRSCALIEGLPEELPCPGAPGVVQGAFNEARRDRRWQEGDLVDALLKGATVRLPVPPSDNETTRKAAEACPTCGVRLPVQPSDQRTHDVRVALCDTCWLFGSQFTASRAIFDDLYLARVADQQERLSADADNASESLFAVQVRDGVGLDRDSGRAVDQIKYDFEVVAAGASFALNLRLEEPEDKDLALVSVGLSEFLAGFGEIGGKRSRGLAKCKLSDLHVYGMDLRSADATGRAKQLHQYLTNQEPAKKLAALATPATADEFLTKQIDTLFSAASAG